MVVSYVSSFLRGFCSRWRLCITSLLSSRPARAVVATQHAHEPGELVQDSDPGLDSGIRLGPLQVQEEHVVHVRGLLHDADRVGSVGPVVHPAHPHPAALECPQRPEEVCRPPLQGEGHRRLLPGPVAAAQRQLLVAVDVGAGRLVLEVALEDLQPELPCGHLAPDNRGVADPVLRHPLGGGGRVGRLLDLQAEAAEALAAVGEGLGGEEAVVDGEDEFADDADAGVADKKVEIAVDGPVEGVLHGGDGAVGGAVLERGERVLHVRAGEEGKTPGVLRRRGGVEGGSGGLLAVGAADALVDDAEGAAGRARVGEGRRAVPTVVLAVDALEAGHGHLEAEAGRDLLGDLQRRSNSGAATHPSPLLV
ncbi:hypothetical protein MUK42_10273 [Musa troglodytarum]|uniref:Uncharacterized protein n=1 Tax=Musa troglodytarum TaxID=320322 RepID=A0A9E7EAM2_9LILI|nr:hypothetical protein MUK42_10273 [Musa troglodytarum]